MLLGSFKKLAALAGIGSTPTYTWAQAKALTGVAKNKKIFVSDIGDGAEFFYNGTKWVPSAGFTKVGKSNIPMIIPSNGNIGNNGALTNLNLPGVYPSCYMYFPTGAIFAASVAGWYYVSMVTINAGTIYNNTYTFGDPIIPITPTPFITTGPGDYVQVLTEITMKSVTIPGGLMGPDSFLSTETLYNYPNSAGAKFFNLKFGGTNCVSNIFTTTVCCQTLVRIKNMGSTQRQISFGVGASNTANTGVGTASTNPIMNTLDTSADQVISYTGKLAVATDFFILIGGSLEVHE
jgi:hypothetical protein